MAASPAGKIARKFMEIRNFNGRTRFDGPADFSGFAEAASAVFAVAVSVVLPVFASAAAVDFAAAVSVADFQVYWDWASLLSCLVIASKRHSYNGWGGNMFPDVENIVPMPCRADSAAE
jgi:hypothetical protein